MTLERLRRDFDEAFTRPRGEVAAPGERLLSLALGEERFVMAVADLAGLVPAPRSVPLPGAPRALVGLAGLRGELVPIYDLAALLGLASGGPPTWLALYEPAQPIAFGFDTLLGHLVAPAENLRPPTALVGGPPVRGILRMPGEPPAALLDLAALAAAARRLHAGSLEERTP
jgi:purine-binding chemotaxis protein CheW